MARSDEEGAVLLADASGIRLARTPAEARRAVAGGFRPSVVLLDARSSVPGDALVRRVTSDPNYSAIPILGISGDGERLRFTLMNDVAALSDPTGLEQLLEILEEICATLPDKGVDEEASAFSPSLRAYL